MNSLTQCFKQALRTGGVISTATMVLLSALMLQAETPETSRAAADTSAVVEVGAETGDVSDEAVENVPKKTFGDLYHDGLYALRNGDSDLAISNFSEALDRNPYHLKSMVNLARSYLAAEEYDSTALMLEKAFVQDDCFADAFHVEGRLYHSMGDLENAVSSYESAIEYDSTNAYTYNNLGYVFIELQQFDDAVPVLERAVELNPNIEYFQNNLGFAYENSGELKKAAKAYKAAVLINPHNDRAFTNLERVEKNIPAVDTEEVAQATETDQ